MSQNSAPDTTASVGTCPGMGQSTPEHAWMQRFVGEWTSKGLSFCMPDQPPMPLSGTETVRSIGGLWMHTLIESDNPEMPYTQVQTLGYDTKKERYIGTVVDSMCAHRWLAEGQVDATGNILTMECEGPFPFRPQPISRFRDVTEFKGPDHKLFTSSIQEADGTWTVLMSIEAWRKTS